MRGVILFAGIFIPIAVIAGKVEEKAEARQGRIKHHGSSGNEEDLRAYDYDDYGYYGSASGSERQPQKNRIWSRGDFFQAYKPSMMDRVGAAAAAMGVGTLIPLIALGAILPMLILPITITIAGDSRRKREAPSSSLGPVFRHLDRISQGLGPKWKEVNLKILDQLMMGYLERSGLLETDLGCLQRLLCLRRTPRTSSDLSSHETFVLHRIGESLEANQLMPTDVTKKLVEAGRRGELGHPCLLLYPCPSSPHPQADVRE